MTVIANPTYAMFFNGISDSVLIPNAKFASTGTTLMTGETSYGDLHSPRKTEVGYNAITEIGAFTLEAWVIPDQGGTIIEYENMFRLSIGSVSGPGPARFDVSLRDVDGGGSEFLSLTTATPFRGKDREIGAWEGITYPYAKHGIMKSYDPTDETKNDVTALTLGHRELLQVMVVFSGTTLELSVNGSVVAVRNFSRKRVLNVSDGRIFLGGRGGEFRGVIESIHFMRGVSHSGQLQSPTVKSDATLGLWRFKEPVLPPNITVTIPTGVSASSSASTITIGVTDAQTLVDTITGNTGNTSVDLTISPYSTGSYSVARYQSGGNSSVTIPHVPYNLLINPLGYNTETGKVINSPPERVRLTTVNASAGTITVESIHLDYDATAATGRRGLIHTRDEAITAILVVGDLLVDSGSDEPYQLIGTASQLKYRTGQVIIDESVYENHGIVFNTEMAITILDKYNKFSVGFGTVEIRYRIGHTARHALNHVNGHPFMSILPAPVSENLTQKVDGISDVFSVVFSDQYGNMKDQVSINSQVSLYDTKSTLPVRRAITSSVAFVAVENGMADIDDTQRSLIAIGGSGTKTDTDITNFDYKPFILKSMGGESAEKNTKIYNRHLMPDSTSRIAILEVPSLADEGYAPFVQVHYNAIDITGETMKYAASARIVSASTTVLTCNSVKAFGKDGQSFLAERIVIGDEPAATAGSSITATLDHAAKTITFSSASTLDFRAADTANAVVSLLSNGPLLLVEKTIPAASTALPSGKQVIDHIHTDLNTSANITDIHAPGGIIVTIPTGSTDIQSGDLIGDDAGGFEYETELDLSLTPPNYMPFHQADAVQSGPMGITASHVNDATHPSVFHKLTVARSPTVSENPQVDSGTRYYTDVKAMDGARTHVRVNYSGGYSAGVTSIVTDGQSASKHFIVGNPVYLPNGTSVGVITSVAHNVIGISAGTLVAVSDGEELFTTSTLTIRGSTNEHTNVHEMFDIVDCLTHKGELHLYIHPTDRLRYMQGSRFVAGKGQGDFNSVSVQQLLSRGRVLSFGDDNKKSIEMVCHGLTSDISGASVDVDGAGAPDSHIIKEIMPGAPVVTVTLGGAGQGAVNTKETFDPSPLARVGWSTRHDYVTRVSAVDASARTVTVVPLNNNADALASWGTYGFPKISRIYVEQSKDIDTDQPNFASAAYASKTGVLFNFASGTGHTGSGNFLLADGTESDSFTAWVTASGIASGNILHMDKFFTQESMCHDGTTINDRLFQSIGNVHHDYQLGTQYASTRAMVEIPLFEEFFFDSPEKGIFTGPDNSMKLHLDATHTAHSWNPNPIGRRAPAVSPQDPEVNSAYSYTSSQNTHRKGTRITRKYDNTNRRIYVEDTNIFPKPSTAAIAVAGIDGSVRYRRAYLPNGEWVLYESIGSGYLQLFDGSDVDTDSFAFSSKFLETMEVGKQLVPAPGFQDGNLQAITDNPLLPSAGYEGRRPYYYDRASMMTQGGNVDYGMKQYVSAVEFRAGPLTNPHLDRIQNKRARSKVTSFASTTLILDDASQFPLDISGTTDGASGYEYRLAYYDTASSSYKYAHYVTRVGNTMTVTVGSGFSPAVGTEIICWDVHYRPANKYPLVLDDKFLNRSWGYPYCPGGLREGDTVWMNMQYTNPHAVEGLFCKSRGVLNEALVSSNFNGGEGAFSANPRDSIPMENFLIGNSCTETAKNFVQHINKTIEMNYVALGLSTALAPTVAYIDPYQSTEEFARVLLYDVAHDREFIAFQDLWMQVQSASDAVKIGTDPVNAIAAGTMNNQTDGLGSQLDVAAGFESQNKYFHPTDAPSEFIEGAMCHNSVWTANATNANTQHVPDVSSALGTGLLPRTNEAAVDKTAAEAKHTETKKGEREISTFFDTPDGTRCIPAFLALKGVRANNLDLSNHEESRLQHLPHWTDMDFIRRLAIDLGEVGVKEGVTDIEAAAREVVRLINQGGALNGLTHARRPADQFLGESERFDLTSIGVKGDSINRNKDPTAAHQHADFSATGSTHDPSPFWDMEKAFASHDRGTHMGYVRAHLGRVVLDSDGNKGYSVIIHSTVPGAAGRNFCVWMDTSRAQSPYRPQYLIGHGGRFRNYWCMPDEITGENMHPAPMPINRHGRPFAPITTLKEYLPPEEPDEPFINNLDFGPDTVGTSNHFATSSLEGTSGRNANTVLGESFEPKSPSSSLVEGLRMGTRAYGRINCGGLVMSGIPGWAPKAGKWGVGRNNVDVRYQNIYGNVSGVSTASMVSLSSGGDGYIPTTDIESQNIGDGELYGIRMVDHRGDSHTVRMIYCERDKPFANDLTMLPSTIDNEIIISFDDKDVAQGGFTVGKHMIASGDVCGEYTAGTKKPIKGNLWQGYPSPAVGIFAAIQKVLVPATGEFSLSITLGEPYNTGGSLSHGDILGYLGFPDTGIVQVSQVSGAGNNGEVFYYTSRTHYPKAGAPGSHYLYGITGMASVDYTSSAVDRIISPRANWTTLLTDEVIAGALEYAINMDDPNSEDIEKTSFDCTGMYAADGRTLGEWGVSPTAIRIKAHSEKHRVRPLKNLFEVTRAKDWGLQNGAAEATAVASHHTGGLSTSEIDAGTRLDVGYIPKTVLHIITKYRGTNANTATPILVDTKNNMVDVTTWRQNLRGEKYSRFVGDHVLPCVNNPMVRIASATIDTGSAPRTMDADSSTFLYLLCTPACTGADSWGDKVTVWLNDEDWAVVRSEQSANSDISLIWNAPEASANFDAVIEAADTANCNAVISRYGQTSEAMEVDGIRRAGSIRSSPLVYFRGAQDSPDHWIPLYFGGGFSGVTMDINDGTQNDYSTFYKHPYATGPTGASGLQNVGEISGSYALLDANAMLAMFPGVPYLDQHKGKDVMPFFNQNAMLPFDLDAGDDSLTGNTGVTYNSGSLRVRCQKPSPIVVRFSHPHARYSATGDSTDHTTYMIFGPGQAIPHNFTSYEPQGSNIITAGNGYSSVPIYIDGTTNPSYLPNSITHGDATSSGFFAYLPRTKNFQTNNAIGYNYVMNWEATQGSPNAVSQLGVYAHNQTEGKGFYYNGHFTSGTLPAPPTAHPFDYIFANKAGNSIGSATLSTTRTTGAVFHMDGGYHPGGHFLDNHVIKNPKQPVSGSRLATGSNNAHNTGAFRVSSLLATAYLSTFDSAADMAVNDNFVIVDATRCQNSEELAAVLSSSINTFPGKDPLKAIGGTFLPSMQCGTKQDRYGWSVLPGHTSANYTAQGGSAATVVVVGAIPTTLPQYGWLRMSSGTKVAIASYVSYSSSTFTLGKNAHTTNTNAFDPITKAAITAGDFNTTGVEVYVWTKAGTHRHNNEPSVTSRDHMCQVHFNGLIDAVDRTKPIGAVGWNGEAYSYLNSYKVTNPGSASVVYPAGKGSWHPNLGFTPYGAAETCLGGTLPDSAADLPASVSNLFCPTELSSRHLVAVTHESEAPLIAKADRDGVLCAGDWLHVKPGTNVAHAGTVQWDTDTIHNKSRYVGPATGGPNVEAMVVAGMTLPNESTDYPGLNQELYWHSQVAVEGQIENATPCQSPTGDLFWDEMLVPANQFHEDYGTKKVRCVAPTTRGHADTIANGLYKFYDDKAAALNFNIEHIVWKRMDGGNLTMPASNARGLGMMPWLVRKSGSDYVTVGEKVLGNCRFSFESTNSAMFPIIQAQELSHPQLAERHPFEIRNALAIPNEELQFEQVGVKDDTGQSHILEGGSPLGTIIYDFRHVSDREIDGLSPALAGSGLSPNMKIRLPNPNEIPGNIIVRSGFDRIQAYQNETMGSGGLQHPLQPMSMIQDTFNHTRAGPRLWPTWENNGWEHISQEGTDVSLAKSATRLGFPDISANGWKDYTNNAPLQTAYEPHDRTLYFHTTRMGHSMTHRYDVDELDFSSYSSSASTVTAGSAPSSTVWKDTSEKSGGRWFLRVYDPTTNKGVIASYTNVSSSNFTGVVVDADFSDFISGKTGLKVVPSYYVPAGSNRFFAARRLRDHSEYSGNSPDMKNIDWANISSTPYTELTAPKKTPMPIPRMGHHYVTPTMALLPGHYAHPLYQRLYDLHRACRTSKHSPLEEDTIPPTAGILNTVPGRDPLIWFSTPTATFGPSDVHGGAFTLLTETKVRYEGYGIAASAGTPGTTNSQGGHALVLEAAGTYTLKGNFPDPMEVGAYQIIIQPNTFKQQLSGFHLNHGTATKAPTESGTKVTELTGQQVNTVIGIEHDASDTNGTYTLVLAEATMADIRGCEVIINEVMLDIEPDANSHFTNIPTLGLYNPLGTNETISPAFSRRSLPYSPNAFIQATPGHTLTMPWWSHLHKAGATNSSATKWLHLEWLKPDNYYEVCRATFGAVGGQITIGGYPSSYFDLYGENQRLRSLNPHCVVISKSYVAATAGITIITDTGGGAPGVQYIGAGDTIVLISTDATTVTLTMQGTGGATTSGSTSGATLTAKTLASGSFATTTLHATAQAVEIKTAINHHTKFSATNTANVITVTQVEAGLAGNTTVTITEIGATGMSKTNFVGGTSSLTVDNNDLFPVVPYYGEKLEHIDDEGLRQTATYVNRTGTLTYATLGASTTFADVTGVPEFWDDIVAGTVLRMSGPYDNWKSGDIYTQSKKTMPPRVLPQTLHGTRDTNSLHSPDAFLCLWHPNLGRPFTWYSDDDSRSFYTKAGAADAPVSKMALNILPEHFETIHYHDFFYAASKGPFALGMNAVAPPHDADNDAATVDIADGTVYTGSAVDALVDGSGTLDHQGATIGSDKYNFAGFWPGGSRGGGGVSRLDGFGDVLIGWGNQPYGLDCVGFRDNTGVQERTYANMTSDSDFARNYCFGYRVSVRQPYNRPRWGAMVRGYVELANANALLGYYNGAFVQQDEVTNGWDYVGSDAGQADVTFTGTYVGVLERLTQITSMLNEDQLSRQVKYSEGRRITRPFGCPVRTIRNSSTVRRLYAGDMDGLDVVELASAHRYYMVDWWGNTRGEDIRRFPARGFGIRPAWDSEDAYADTNIAHRPKNNNLFMENVATAKITMVTATASHLDDATLTITSTDGTVRIYTWDDDAAPTDTAVVGSGTVRYVRIQGDSSAATFATRLENAIEHADGHNGKITVSRTGATLLLTQADYQQGTGNNAITNSLSSVAATAAITIITDTGGGAPGVQYIGAGDTIELIATDGLLVTLTMQATSGSTTSSTTSGATLTAKTLASGSFATTTLHATAQAVEIRTAINHHTKFSATNSTNVITVTQAEAGSNGNTAITITEIGATGMSKTDFTGGNTYLTVSGFSGGSFVDMQSGNVNEANNDTTGMEVVDWFNPASTLRIGDRGDGRGVRWPTVFNESLLHEISTPLAATGIVLSHSTSEPNFGQGLIRPRNDGLQTTEIERGISARLGVSSTDGLLKPEANVGEGIETVSGTFTPGGEVFSDPVARTGPRIGLDMDTVDELQSGIQRDYVVMSTQATSLHTDREVGQRISLRGALNVGSQTLGDLDLTAVSWAAQPTKGIIRMSNTHAMWALGGTYVLEARSHGDTFDDKGWGKAASGVSSNPYQNASHYPIVQKTNVTDKVIRFLMRPTRVLDNRHFQMFRHNPAVKSGSPQASANFYRATSGGKYGMFNYDIPSARDGTVTPTTVPYTPVYSIDPSSSTTAASSYGPKVPGADASGFDNTDIRQTTGRMVMSENTLQHFRSDAPRRRAEKEEGKESRPDYTVQPRHSQTLHPKGEDATTSFNTGDHSGE